jgi:hypothetical protein
MKKTITFFVALALSLMLNAQTQWVEFTRSVPQPPVIELNSSDSLSVSFNAEICGMYETDTTVNSTLFQRINIPGCGRFTITGQPEMPFVRVLIAIPECDGVTLSVDVRDDMSLEDYYVYPAPDYQEVIDTSDLVYMEEVFDFDTVAYSTNLYNPQLSGEIHSIGYFRAQKYAEVYLYPVRFNPVSEDIEIDMSYNVTLTFDDPTTSVNMNVGIFNNIATNAMLNYPSTGISAVINDNVDPDGTVEWITLPDTGYACTIVADYLIICSDPFFDSEDTEVLRIATHRATYNGFDVAIINVENILSLNFEYDDPAYMDEQKIRTCIRRIYEGANAQHTLDGKLGYVLLIGDVDEGNMGMPTSHKQVIEYWPLPNDYYFCCVTRENEIYDLIGDLFIGRLGVDNNTESGVTELHNIVDKTLLFENEYGFENWRKNVGFINDGSSYTPEYQSAFYTFLDNIIQNEQITFVAGTQSTIHQSVIDLFNEGSIFTFYDGNGNPITWEDNLDTYHFETELTNLNKFPFVFSYSCQTGLYEHTADCLGEFLTTYSEDKGCVGFLGATVVIAGIYIYPPLTFITLPENLPVSIWNHSCFVTGEFVLDAKMHSYLYVDNIAFNLLGDPGMNLMAQGFEITHDVTIPETASITKEVFLRSGNTITMPSNSTLLFENDGKLIVEEDATLYIDDDATLSAISGTDSLIVYGNLVVGSDVHFNATEGASFVIDIRNEDLTETITSATFEDVTLLATAEELNFSSCDFTDSYVELHKVDYNQYYLYQCYFDNTPLKACRYGASATQNVGNIVISDCHFINGSGLSAIEIYGFPNFQIINNSTVYYSEGDGISLYYSGNDRGTTHLISNCEINFTGNPADDTHGLKAHYSRVDIVNNYIHGNDIGLACLQRSSLSLTGNSQSRTEEETQRIKDNISVQVYSDGSSFPYEFEYNSIFNDNEEDYVVKMDNNIYAPYDIRYNYWGENFTPGDDLYPANAYTYLPVWEPSWADDKSSDEAKILFYSAKQDIIDSSYAEAKDKFKQLIENYPGSKYQKASVKEILQVTDLFDQDYAGLQIYLDTVPALWEDDEISGITEYIMNWCDIKLQNYTAAINWFEDRILNPVSFADSILSIIDLGYIYSLMEDGGSRGDGYTGKLPQYRFATQALYAKNREYLIDLLTRGKSNVTQDVIEIPAIKAACFNQIYPNPAVNGQLTIGYYLPEDAKVVVNVYNPTGELVEMVNGAFQTTGEHTINLQSSHLSPGIYIATLEINGKIADFQKVVVVK